MNVKVRMLDNL